MPEYPFPDEVVSTVADERAVDPDALREALARIQRHFERGDGEYDYSSMQNYGWTDGAALCLYGSEHLWDAIGADLSLSDDLLTAARAVHERWMRRSAADRDEESAVEDMFDDGNTPLVLADTGAEPPLFGQDV
ncbi:MAG: hypothetical protein ABEJ31_11950 [Haloarculaceae archaeon]